jgi:hypothetical protein
MRVVLEAVDDAGVARIHVIKIVEIRDGLVSALQAGVPKTFRLKDVMDAACVETGQNLLRLIADLSHMVA